MSGRIELFYIQKHKIDQREQFFHIRIPYSAVAVQTDMYSIVLKHLDKRNESLCLCSRLTSGKCHPAFLAEKRFFPQCHIQNLFRFCRLASRKGNRVRIGTIKAAERASLKKYDEPETRPVICSH